MWHHYIKSDSFTLNITGHNCEQYDEDDERRMGGQKRIQMRAERQIKPADFWSPVLSYVIIYRLNAGDVVLR